MAQQQVGSVTYNSTRQPQLEFSLKAWLQIWLLTSRCDIEISGFGIVAKDNPSYVEEFFIVEQECSVGETDPDLDKLSQLALDLEEKGINPSRLRVWWHSHGSIPAYPSSTDVNTANVLSNGAYLWMVITSKTGVQAALNPGVNMPDRSMFVGLERYDPLDQGNYKSCFRSSTVGSAHMNIIRQFSAGAEVITEEWVVAQLAKVKRKSQARQSMTYAGPDPYASTATTQGAQQGVQRWPAAGAQQQQQQQQQGGGAHAALSRFLADDGKPAPTSKATTATAAAIEVIDKLVDNKIIPLHMVSKLDPADRGVQTVVNKVGAAACLL